MRTPHRFVQLVLCALATAPFCVSHAAASEWLDLDWGRRVEIRAKPELIGGNFENFTLLLSVDSDSLASILSEANPDGSDLVFTTSDGVTVIDHEVVSFDPVGGHAEIWFEAPTFSPTDNVFYAYFGNSVARSLNVPSVAWSSDYLGVYHFDEDPMLGSQSDSSPAGNVAFVGEAAVFQPADTAPGQIGQGWVLDGIDNYMYTPSMSTPDSSFTISAWYSNDPAVSKSSIAMATSDPYWELSFQRSGFDVNAQIGLPDAEVYWQPSVQPGVMRHYVWTMDAVNDTVRFFLDGVEQPIRIRWTRPGTPNKTYTGETLDGRVSIASPLFGAPENACDGIVDEFRIATGVRSPEWIATEYRNQADGVTFFSYDVQTAPTSTAVGGTVLSGQGIANVTVWPNPFRAVADVNVETAVQDLAVNVYDVAGRLVRRLPVSERQTGLLRLRWDGRDDEGRTVGNGIYFVRAIHEGGVASAKIVFAR